MDLPEKNSQAEPVIDLESLTEKLNIENHNKMILLSVEKSIRGCLKMGNINTNYGYYDKLVPPTNSGLKSEGDSLVNSHL